LPLLLLLPFLLHIIQQTSEAALPRTTAAVLGAVVSGLDLAPLVPLAAVTCLRGRLEAGHHPYMTAVRRLVASQREILLPQWDIVAGRIGAEVLGSEAAASAVASSRCTSRQQQCLAVHLEGWVRRHCQQQQQQQQVLLDQQLLLLLSSAVGLVVTVMQEIRCRRCRAVRRLLLLLVQALSSQILTS
jgi:hypothetical protein